MKKIFAIAILALLSSSAFAHDRIMGGNPDMYGSPLLDHGTAEKAHALQMGYGDQYGSSLIAQPSDHADKSTPTDVQAYNDPKGIFDILNL